MSSPLHFPSLKTLTHPWKKKKKKHGRPTRRGCHIEFNAVLVTARGGGGGGGGSDLDVKGALPRPPRNML